MTFFATKSPIGDNMGSAMNQPGMNRRSVVAWSGAVVAVACSGGMLRTTRAREHLPEGNAYAPWQLWNAPALRGTPLALVSAAVLAANPHDTQPWLFRVRNETIEVFADLSRNLGAMDAYVREMHLGLGCAIQNALLAAAPNGFSAELEISEGNLLHLADRQGTVLAATLHLSRQRPSFPDSLGRAIPKRHTNRYAYDRDKPLPRDWLEFPARGNSDDGVRVFLFRDGRDRGAFDSAVIDATQAIIADMPMIAASDRWVRTSSSEIEKHRDGPTLDAAGLSPLTLMLAKLFPVSPAMSHQAWLDHTRETQLATAPLGGVIAVRDRYDRQTAIEAGRTWQRLHLSATARGIAMQPLNQPIEMIDRERQKGGRGEWAARIARLTGNDWQATFSFRAGYPSREAPASPRRALKDVLLP